MNVFVRVIRENRIKGRRVGGRERERERERWEGKKKKNNPKVC